MSKFLLFFEWGFSFLPFSHSFFCDLLEGACALAHVTGREKVPPWATVTPQSLLLCFFFRNLGTCARASACCSSLQSERPGAQSAKWDPAPWPPRPGLALTLTTAPSSRHHWLRLFIRQALALLPRPALSSQPPAHAPASVSTCCRHCSTKQCAHSGLGWPGLPPGPRGLRALAVPCYCGWNGFPFLS